MVLYVPPTQLEQVAGRDADEPKQLVPGQFALVQQPPDRRWLQHRNAMAVSCAPPAGLDCLAVWNGVAGGAILYLRHRT